LRPDIIFAIDVTGQPFSHFDIIDFHYISFSLSAFELPAFDIFIDYATNILILLFISHISAFISAEYAISIASFSHFR